MPRTPKEVRFELNADELAILDKPIRGKGGFQSFGRKLQNQINRQTNTISLDDADLGRIVRHIVYEPGSFETRLRDAFGRNLRRVLSKKKPVPLFPDDT